MTTFLLMNHDGEVVIGGAVHCGFLVIEWLLSKS